MKTLVIIIVSGLFSFLGVRAQEDVSVPFDSDRWDLTNAEYTFQEYEGKKAILLQQGFIFLKDLKLLNGSFEFDINFSSLRNFPGVAFRVQEDFLNFEEFYLRPHQSGNPDANQYNPVFNGLSGWQLYHGEEYSTPVNYEFNKWHHIKIVVHGNQAEVYFDDMDKPLLEISELKQKHVAGTIGMRTFTNVHFANFQYQLNEEDVAEVPIARANIEGLIENWQISDLNNNGKFQDKQRLTKSDLADIEWTTCSVQSEGFLNIAEFVKIKPDSATAVVKLEINSEKAVMKQVDFGYSDFVRIYLNGQIVYSGANNFRSRDYRYLGTIGFFDTVYLPLKKGNNQVLFVVRENFGGWGLQAKIADREGIQLK